MLIALMNRGLGRLGDRLANSIACSVYGEAIVCGDVPAILDLTVSVGQSLWQMHREPDMVTVLEPAIALAREAHAISELARIANLCSLGLGYCGEHKRAIALLGEAYEDCKRDLNREIEATRREAELTHLGQPIVIFRPNSLNLRQQMHVTANNLMVHYQEMGALDDAVAWGERALQHADFMARIREELPLPARTLAVDIEPTVQVRLNVSDVILDAGRDPKKAAAHLDEVNKQLGWHHRYLHMNERALLHYVKAKLLLCSGQECSNNIKNALQDAWRYHVGNGFTKLGAEMQLWHSVAEAREQNWLGCKMLLEQANLTDDQCLQAIFPVCSDDTKLAFVASIRRRTDAYLSLVLEHFINDPRARATAFDLCLRRKGLSASIQASRSAAILSGRYPNLAPLLEEHTAICRRIAALASSGGEDDIGNIIATLNERRRHIEVELSRAVPEPQIHGFTENVDREVIARALSRDQVLVEFLRVRIFDFGAVYPNPIWRTDHYIAFVVRSAEFEDLQMVDLGEADPIDRMIAEFRAEITGPGRGLGLPSSELRRSRQVHYRTDIWMAVCDPWLRSLKDCGNLVVSPDGELCRLPFEVLPTGNGQRMIDDFQISYLTCARDLRRSSVTSVQQPSNPIVVANPDFNLRDSRSTLFQSFPSNGSRKQSGQSRDWDRVELYFEQLPATKKEGEQIAMILGVEPMVEATALEGRLKKCRSPSILHVATHGFFFKNQERNPVLAKHELTDALCLENDSQGRLNQRMAENPLLRSGLALAGANTWLKKEPLPPEAEDGLLTAEDITGMDLLSTELVTLSACETGLGDIQNGEGVFGIRRAFAIAGAKTLVMSLWKVPDDQTQELMVDFYNRLLTGESRVEALRQAQLAMKKKHHDPWYWGAFICQGDRSPLSYVVNHQLESCEKESDTEALRSRKRVHQVNCGP
jgi:CHAT domain-containing protein